MEISAYSVSVGHGYQYHDGYGWWGPQSLQHHTYLIFSTIELKLAIAFVYGASFSVVKRPAIVSGENREEQDVGGVSKTNKNGRTNKKYKSDKEENRNEGFNA